MKRIIMLFFTIACFLWTSAISGVSPQKGDCQITVEAPQFKNGNVFLGYYFNGKTYASDTARINEKGIGTIVKGKKLPEGVYFFYTSPAHYYEFILSDKQKFSVKIDTLPTADHLIFKGAEQSEDFVKYTQFLMKKRIEFNNKFSKLDSIEAIEKGQELSAQVEKEVTNYQHELINKYRDGMLSVFMKGLLPIETPTSILELPDSTRYIEQYQYYKKHYFDYMDFRDIRILRTPYFANKLDTYLSRVLVQYPDSLLAPVVELVEKSKVNDTIYEVVAKTALNYVVKTPLMGMDNLIVALYDNFFDPDKEFFRDSVLHENLTKEVAKYRKNPIGSTGRNLTLTTMENQTFDLYDVKNEFVLVYFYEPSCGHCKKSTPVLHDSIYNKYKNMGFSVVAIYTQTNQDEWKEFTDNNKLDGWINAWDPHRTSYYWQYYDVSTTPGVYLFNKDWKLVAKKLSMESLEKFLEYELIIKKEQKNGAD